MKNFFSLVLLVLALGSSQNLSAQPCSFDLGHDQYCGYSTVTAVGCPSCVYVWTGPGIVSGQGTNQITVNVSGNYTATSNGCPVTKYVAVHFSPTATTTTTTNAIDLTVTGGTSPYLYTWSNGATTQDIGNLLGGTYTVTIEDYHNCFATASATVIGTPPPAPTVNLTVSPNTVGCGGSSNLNWTSVNATTCVANASPANLQWSGAKNTSGTQSVSLTASTVFTLICTGPGGTTTSTASVVATPLSATITADGPVSFCQGGSVTLTATPGFSYQWNTGATTQGVNVTTGGTYFVTVTNASGCSATASQLVTVNSLPSIPTITVTQTGSGSATLSAPPGYVYLWSNGATMQNITVTQAGLSTYTVKVFNASGCWTISAQVTIFVTDCGPTLPPCSLTASAIATPTTCNGCTDGAVNLATTGGTMPLAYAWSNGANTQNLVSIYAGVYCVTVTDANGCMAAACAVVTQPVVVSQPIAGFTMSQSSGCAPLIVNFTSTSLGNPTSYLWTFPNGSPSSSTAQNPSVAYATAGTYTATLTVSNPAGSNTTTQTVTVSSMPTASFIATTNGLTATFVSPSGATSYVWNFGDGQSSTLQSPTHTYAIPGTYPVTLFAVNNCGVSQTSQNVTVSGGVQVPIAAFSANTTNGCAPSVIQFLDQSIGATSWLWSFSGGLPASSNLQNPMVVYSQPGVYSVTLTVSNSAGTHTTIMTNFVTVGLSPFSSFNYDNSGGATIVFTNTSTGATSFQWNFGDGIVTSDPNPSHTYVADGLYTVILTATNSCGSVSYSQSVQVVVCQAGIQTSTGGTDVCQDQYVILTAPSGYNYVWNNGFAGVQVIPADTEDLGNVFYSVTVTYVGGSTASFCLNLTVLDCGDHPSSSEEKTKEDFGIKVFPNPTSGFVNIELPEDISGKMDITIYSPDGKLTINQDLSKGEAIDVSDIPSGMYLLSIKVGERQYWKKFVKV